MLLSMASFLTSLMLSCTVPRVPGSRGDTWFPTKTRNLSLFSSDDGLWIAVIGSILVLFVGIWALCTWNRNRRTVRQDEGKMAVIVTRSTAPSHSQFSENDISLAPCV